MKNIFFFLLLTLGLTQTIQAQDQQPGTPMMADKVVAVVGNAMILYSDMIQVAQGNIDRARQQGVTLEGDQLCEALEELIIQKILFNRAKSDSIYISLDGVANMVENTVQDEIERLGSQRAVELYYHKPIFDIRQDLTTRFEENQYAYTMRSNIRSEASVNHNEVERYYRKLPKDSLPLIPEQYIYSQIFRYPPSIEEAKLRTRTRLLEMRERIMNGTKFETLARMYSEDPGSAIRGGEMEPMPREGFVQPFSDALAKLKPGQVSEVVETEYGFHLIELIEKKGNNLYHCRHILLKPQFTVDELEVSFILLDSVKKEILDGNLTFAAAAQQYSNDKFSKNNGGVVSNLDLMEALNNSNPKEATTRFLREELAPEVYNVMKDMKVGDISEPFASQDLLGNLMCKMIRLDEIIPAHPANLEEDYLRIEEIAVGEKREEHYQKWLREAVAGMFIRIDEEFRDCNFKMKELVK